MATIRNRQRSAAAKLATKWEVVQKPNHMCKWCRGHLGFQFLSSENRKRCWQTGSRQSTPLINDTDPIRKFSIDPGSHTDWHNPAEFSPKGKPIRNFRIDPTSSIRTSIADAIFADAISETPMSFLAVLVESMENHQRSKDSHLCG